MGGAAHVKLASMGSSGGNRQAGASPGVKCWGPPMPCLHTRAVLCSIRANGYTDPVVGGGADHGPIPLLIMG